MRVGLYQFAPEFGEVAKNMAKVEQGIASAHADLIVLPELFNSGYHFASPEEVSELAEVIPGGSTTKRLIQLAQDCGFWIIAGIPEYAPQEDRYYNSAVIVSPKGYEKTYRKVHLFYKENLWFSPGEQIFPVLECAPGVKIGVMICFDWFFPEAARSLALRGAQIICQPSNLVLPYCQQAMITRSLENRVFSITANRVGVEHRADESLTFTGQSQVVSPFGEVLCRLTTEEERLAVVEIKPEQAADKSLNAYNDLFGSRRPQFYSAEYFEKE